MAHRSQGSLKLGHKHLEILQEFLKLLTAQILRSTFERHRLAVAMHLLRFLAPLSSSSGNSSAATSTIATPQEWALLLTGAAIPTSDAPDGNLPASVTGVLRCFSDACFLVTDHGNRGEYSTEA